MICKICLRTVKSGPFVTGSRNYRLKILCKHTASRKHKAAVEAQILAPTMKKALQKAWSEAVIAALQVCYWLGSKKGWKDKLQASHHRFRRAAYYRQLY